MPASSQSQQALVDEIIEFSEELEAVKRKLATDDHP